MPGNLINSALSSIEREGNRVVSVSSELIIRKATLEYQRLDHPSTTCCLVTIAASFLGAARHYGVQT